LTAKLPPFPAVDAKGRPLGYWGKFAGCRADLECEPSAEPPPEPHHFQWHAWSVKTLSAVRGPLHTTEIVRGEACWQLGGNTQTVHALLGLVRVGAIQLVEAIQVADQLSSEDQAGLAAHLLAGIRACPLGPDDVELQRREAEMETDSATLLTHEQFGQAVGR
jgi:hypothetical protein